MLNNAQKSVFAENEDVIVKLTFGCEMSPLHHVTLLDICVKICHN